MSETLAPVATFLSQPGRYLFFTGKGGVGKTALSCATALHLAAQGRRVLLVSTDPASNLAEMLELTVSGVEPTPVPVVPGLWVLNIDPDQAAEAYRERVLGPHRAHWTPAELAQHQEELAGACTVEIAAFDAFATLLTGEGQDFEQIVFDTAPTGHTLRLLSLPQIWSGYLQSTAEGASCLGPHSGLKLQQHRFERALAALTDGTQTTVVLVARPEAAALREAERSAGELEALGIREQALVINALFTAADPTDRIAVALETRGQKALAAMPARLKALPVLTLPLRPFNMVGRLALQALLDDRLAETVTPLIPAGAPPAGPPLAELVEALARPGKGLIMVMGKGGVGKTTLAAAIAAALASRGYPVHLSTTDPAAHLASTLTDTLPNLTLSRIDPQAETEAYVARVMQTRGARLDQAGRALLAEDLRSPCYQEVAVFTAFSKLVAQAHSRFVVLDTAPTGHTLLLLDTTGHYHRQLMRGSETPEHLTTPLMRLQNRDQCKILLVTLAETTPVSEAAQLQADLQRAGIDPFAWIINGTLVGSGSNDPCLQQRMWAESQQIARVRAGLTERLALVPWQPEEPVGAERLLALTRQPL
jgi:arsenite-transporting ATPase